MIDIQFLKDTCAIYQKLNYVKKIKKKLILNNKNISYFKNKYGI